MPEKATYCRHAFAAGSLPTQTSTPDKASPAAGSKSLNTLEQLPDRVPVWMEPGAFSRLRCVPRTRSSARFAHVMTKAQGKVTSTPIGAAGISASRARTVTSDEATTSRGKAARYASQRKDQEFDRVLELVSRHFDVPISLLLHHSRCRAPIARARQVAMYLMNTSLSRTMVDIGAYFGRDRTTVAYACARVEDWRDDAAFEAELTALEAAVGALVAIAGDEVRSNG